MLSLVFHAHSQKIIDRRANIIKLVVILYLIRFLDKLIFLLYGYREIGACLIYVRLYVHDLLAGIYIEFLFIFDVHVELVLLVYLEIDMVISVPCVGFRVKLPYSELEWLCLHATNILFLGNHAFRLLDFR